MSEAKHTPGALFVLTPDPQYPLTFWIENETDDLDSQENYVSFSGYFGSYGPELFAAAPELLEALKDALTLLEHHYQSPAPNGQIAKARAAIAKAEGRLS